MNLETPLPLKASLGDSIGKIAPILGIRGIIIAVLLSYIGFLSTSYPRVKGAPFVGYRRWYEPTLLVRFRHLTSARKILHEGYSKYKNDMFVMRRMDNDITIISNRYLAELKDLPLSKLNSTVAQIANLTAEYTWLHLVAESNQHVRVLQNHLTPNLSTFVKRAEGELKASFESDMPKIDATWKEVNIQDIIRFMVSQMSSIVFVGEPLCRNEEWLRICRDYTLNVSGTAFMLRLFPPLVRPVLARLLPQRYKLWRNIQDAERLVRPLIAERKASRTVDEGPSTLLGWMVDTAQGKEARPEELSLRQLNLTIASIGTMTSAISNAVFDLCAHPEVVQPLREEIAELYGDEVPALTKQDLTKLYKLDSFLTESQRFNATLNVTSQRQALETITLKDGTVIPKDTRIAFPHNAIVMDPSINPNPNVFDAFRSSRKRQSTKHSLVHTSPENLTFGYGKAACPGRFFGVNVMKIVVGRFLMEYDFSWPEGKGRPRNLEIDELVFPDPKGTVMLRRRV